MKKIITLIVLLTITSLSYGQLIYNNIIKVDKFHDITYSKEIKTIVSLTDTMITIETKGQTPLEYIIKGITKIGSADNPVNLVNDIWGYEFQFAVKGKRTSKPYIIVYRIITYQYTGTYKSDGFWVEDANNNRTIYTTIE